MRNEDEVESSQGHATAAGFNDSPNISQPSHSQVGRGLAPGAEGVLGHEVACKRHAGTEILRS
jgi:hypothetical protein